jgi:hypothetical protein
VAAIAAPLASLVHQLPAGEGEGEGEGGRFAWGGLLPAQDEAFVIPTQVSAPPSLCAPSPPSLSLFHSVSPFVSLCLLACLAVHLSISISVVHGMHVTACSLVRWRQVSYVGKGAR